MGKEMMVMKTTIRKVDCSNAALLCHLPHLDSLLLSLAISNKMDVKCTTTMQGCISCGVLLSGTGARGVSSEHMENMEMFSCSPT